MAISPLKSEAIAFEHPCFLVEHYMLSRRVSGKCNERRVSCKTRNRLVPALVLAFSAMLAACAPQAVQTASVPMIAGGWQAADPGGEGVQAAAQYAAANLPQSHGALARVSSAETQVVAGTNVRMVLSMADGTRWKTTVWHRLDGTYALTEAVPLR